MSDLDRGRAEGEARRYTSDAHQATRYSDAVNRYIGAINYQDLTRTSRSDRVHACSPAIAVTWSAIEIPLSAPTDQTVFSPAEPAGQAASQPVWLQLIRSCLV
jgi:hypothetical protein